MKGALEEKLTSTMSDFVIDVNDNVLKHPRNLVKVFGRDGAEVNELAIKKLTGAEFRDERNKVIVWPAQYKCAFNIKCFSHTIDRCGADYKTNRIEKNRIEGPNLREFYNTLNGLMGSASNIPNDMWRQYFESSFPSVSATRWWSREMFHEYVFEFFYATDKRKSTIMDWVKLMCEQNKIPDGVRIKCLHKILVKEDPDHDVFVKISHDQS